MRLVPSAFGAVLPTLLLSAPRHAAIGLVAEPLSTDPYRPPPSKLWEQPADFVVPEELMGPWEVQCTMSGYGAMWIELCEDGACKCSAKIGKGRQWSATPIAGGQWRVRFVLLDKLSRSLRWEATVQPDDTRGMVITGEVRGPPKRKAASKAEIEHGVVVGEFSGYHLA